MLHRDKMESHKIFKYREFRRKEKIMGKCNKQRKITKMIYMNPTLQSHKLTMYTFQLKEIFKLNEITRPEYILSSKKNKKN